MGTVNGNTPDPRLAGMFKADRDKQTEAVSVRDTCWQVFTRCFTSKAKQQERGERRAFRAEVWAAHKSGERDAAWKVVESWDTELQNAQSLDPKSAKYKAFQHELKKITTIGRNQLQHSRSTRGAAEASPRVSEEGKRIDQSGVRTDREAETRKTRTRTGRRRRGGTQARSKKAAAPAVPPVPERIRTTESPDTVTQASSLTTDRQQALSENATKNIQDRFGKDVHVIGRREASQLTGAECDRFLDLLKGLPEHESGREVLRARRKESLANKAFIAELCEGLNRVVSGAERATVDELSHASKLLKQAKQVMTSANPNDVSSEQMQLLQTSFDTVKSNWKDAMQEQKTSRHDFSATVKKIIQNAASLSGGDLAEIITSLKKELENIKGERREYRDLLKKGLAVAKEHLTLRKIEKEEGKAEETVARISAIVDEVTDKGTSVLKGRMKKWLSGKSGDISSATAYNWIRRLQGMTHTDQFTRFSSMTLGEAEAVYKELVDIKDAIDKHHERIVTLKSRLKS